MEEVLEGIIKDRIYDENIGMMVTIKEYHIYLDEDDTIIIDEPVTPKKLQEIRRKLKSNGIKYKNLIIGNPEI